MMMMMMMRAFEPEGFYRALFATFDLAACTQTVDETYPESVHGIMTLNSDSAPASQAQHPNIVRKVISQKMFRSIWDG